MSKKQIALTVLLVIVVVVLVAAVVADKKFGVILSSPKVSYETLVKPETRAEIVLDVPKAQDIIKAKLPANVPAWVLPLALPNSGALLINPDYVLNKMDLTMFINEQRLGPVILQQINARKLPAPIADWFQEPMAAKERGKLLRNGEAPLDKALLAKVKEICKGKAAVTAPLKVEGGHLLEVMLDNRDGSLLTIAGTLAMTQGLNITDPAIEGYLGIAAPLDCVRIQADLADAKTAKVRVVLECAPGTDPDQVKMMSMGLDMGMPYLQQPLSDQGLALTGGTSIKGNIVSGEYTIAGIDKLLAKL